MHQHNNSSIQCFPLKVSISKKTIGTNLFRKRQFSSLSYRFNLD